MPTVRLATRDSSPATTRAPRARAVAVERGADGVRVDVQGHVYAVGPAAWVYSTAGKLPGKIATPTSPTNLCFGGPDNKRSS